MLLPPPKFEMMFVGSGVLRPPPPRALAVRATVGEFGGALFVVKDANGGGATAGRCKMALERDPDLEEVPLLLALDKKLRAS